MPNQTDSTSAFFQARDRGCEYLLAHLRPDGGAGAAHRGVADYYKVASALQVCGENRAANRLCQWIRRHGITPDGDFGPRPLEASGYYYAYYNSWVILGAHRLGQYDLSQRGMDFLMRFHDPVTGGFYSSATERTPETLQDIWVVSGCGQAALMTGRIEPARAVGRWMREVMRQQPEFPKRLYGVFSRANGLETHFDPAAAVRYVSSQDAQCDQFVFNPGISAGFLCRLYQATREIEWLELAKQFMVFAEGMNDFLVRLLRSGKVGWASSVLYTLTGEEKYRQLAMRVGNSLVESQKLDGTWNLGDFFPEEAALDIAAEMVVWLDEICQAVGSERVAGQAT